MLKQRLLTAAVGLPVLLFCLVAGPFWLVGLLMAVFLALGAFEAAHLFAPRIQQAFGAGQSPVGAFSPRYACAGLGVMVFLAWVFGINPAPTLLLVIAGTLMFAMAGDWSPERIIANSALMLMTLGCAVVPWLAIWRLYEMGPGSRYVIFLLAVVWCGDSGAYFAGRFLGRRPLAPLLSPKKTREGAWGGLACSLAGGAGAQLFYGDLGPWPLVMAASMIGGVVAQLGDLWESALKRFADTKDSGAIFPGHGGVLDRIDGLLFAAPTILWILSFHRV